MFQQKKKLSKNNKPIKNKKPQRNVGMIRIVIVWNRGRNTELKLWLIVDLLYIMDK